MVYHIVTFGWDIGWRMWLHDWVVLVLIALLVTTLLPIGAMGSPNTCLGYELYKYIKGKIKKGGS